MHVLLIHQAFASLDEAGGTRHHELARYLAGQGHRVTVIASPVSYLSGATRSGHRPRWVERQQDGENITILRTYTYSALHRSFFHRLLSFFSFMFSSFWVGVNVPKVDLVWGTSPPIFQGVTAWAVARLKRVPFLFEVRDLWPAFAVAVGVLRQPLLIRASEWLERFLYRHADRVMVNSPGYVEHVRARGARRVELIPNGADPAMFDPQADGADFRRKNGLDGKIVAMYAGAHGMSNDLGVVLAAARELTDCPDLAVVMLGDGKDKPALMAQAQSENLQNVVFLPPAPKTEMGEALAAADLCIAILKPLAMYATTYPNKVFDYMAAGRPVVLAIDGVIRKVVEEAGAGIFVPPGNAHALAQALRQLANDPQTRRRMGANGRSAIETHFSRVDLAQRLTELLEEMERNRG
ncbi:MAG: glycosyltransferase family 4 protein [Anaerolineaceae bacterium]